MSGSRWSPAERLDLIDRLAAMPGSDSAALFQAFGLGRAYSAPGKNAGKKTKIVAGLNAAEARGLLDEVLDAAAHLEQEARLPDADLEQKHGTPSTGASTAQEIGAGPMPHNRRIFISHSSRDGQLVDLVMDSLSIGGVRSEAVFCSSTPGSGIGAGKDVLEGLRSALDDAVLLVELLTTNYLKSTMCVMEYGAAWATRKPTFPIVFPPLTRPEAIAALGNVQMHQASSDKDIDRFYDELHTAVTAATGDRITFQNWNRGRAHFKGHISAVLRPKPGGSAPTTTNPPTPAPRKTLSRAVTPKVAPRPDRGHPPADDSEESEGFEKLEDVVAALRGALGELCDRASRLTVLHWATWDEPLRPEAAEEMGYADRAREIEFDEDNGGWVPRESNAKVARALRAAAAMRAAFREADPEVAEEFTEAHGLDELDAQSHELWKRLRLTGPGGA